SSHIGASCMSKAEHRKPCEPRGSCTVLGARGGEIPPRDSPIFTVPIANRLSAPQSFELCAKLLGGQDRLARIRLADCVRQMCGASGGKRRPEPLRLVEQGLICP